MNPADFIEGDFIDPGTGGSFSAAADGFAGLMGVVAVIIVGTIIFGGVVALRKYRVLKDAGIDPLTVDATIAAKVINSDALSSRSQQPAVKSIEERLRELDDLRARFVITEDEYREARAAALRG